MRPRGFWTSFMGVCAKAFARFGISSFTHCSASTIMKLNGKHIEKDGSVR